MKQTIITIITVCLSGILLSGCKCGCLEAEKVNTYPISLGSHSALKPEPRPSEWWIQRHQAVLSRVKQGNVDMIFIGDSITHDWEKSGKEVWQQYYAKRNAVNMGFSGDRTQHVLWRLNNGEIAAISPKLAILMIGTNNSDGSDNTAQEIGEGIIAICQKLRKDLPNTKILMLGIFPRGEKPSVQREKNAEASRLASSIVDNQWIYYMDIKDVFLDKDGTLPKEIMPDYVHLSEKGYQLEAEALEPMIAQLMGES